MLVPILLAALAESVVSFSGGVFVLFRASGAAPLVPLPLAALAESVVSFSGGFFVLFRESVARWVAHRMLAFAIGALIGVSFFDIIPEAIEAIGQERTVAY